MIIDLRSDTVTKPTPGMLQAMWAAKVGDDVYGEDPTINALEEKAAKLFGKEAGLFCPSGTMTNQIAIKCHTNPLEEVICDRSAHIYNYEGGGIAFNSSASVRLIHGEKGIFSAQDVLDNINPPDNHYPKTSLVVAENTSNRGGGSCWSLDQLSAISKICKEKNLAFHLDGARVFNALVARNEQAITHGNLFDSVSICLSKGLGAPVGSLLLGTSDFIKKAKRVRKVFGGGMRQAGYLAAAGIYALDHQVTRLAEDHARAQSIASILQQANYIEQILPVETNILIFRLVDKVDANEFVQKMKTENILCNTFGKQMVRFVTHHDFTDPMLEKLERILKSM